MGTSTYHQSRPCSRPPSIALGVGVAVPVGSLAPAYTPYGTHLMYVQPMPPQGKPGYGQPGHDPAHG
jgi:hypothetical protein